MITLSALFLTLAIAGSVSAGSDPVFSEALTFELLERQVARTGYAGTVGVVAVKQGDGWVMSQGYPQPFGKCDDKGDCEAAVKKMCEDAGHGGVKPESVEVTQGKMCSGDCKQHGAVAFVMCAEAQLLAR